MKSESKGRQGGKNVTHGGAPASGGRSYMDHGERGDRDTLRNKSLEGEMRSAVRGTHLNAGS